MSEQLGQPFVLVYQLQRWYEKPTHKLIFHYPFDPHHRVERPYNDIAVCEHAFAVFNVGDDPDFVSDVEDQQLATEYRATGATSLSVGDVLCLKNFGGIDRYYRCDSVGFSRTLKAELTLEE